jgi:hypothetical protein
MSKITEWTPDIFFDLLKDKILEYVPPTESGNNSLYQCLAKALGKSYNDVLKKCGSATLAIDKVCEKLQINMYVFKPTTLKWSKHFSNNNNPRIPIFYEKRAGKPRDLSRG